MATRQTGESQNDKRKVPCTVPNDKPLVKSEKKQEDETEVSTLLAHRMKLMAQSQSQSSGGAEDTTLGETETRPTPETTRKRKRDELVDSDEETKPSQSEEGRSRCDHHNKKGRFRFVYHMDDNGKLVKRKVDAEAAPGLFKNDDNNNDDTETDDRGRKKRRSHMEPRSSRASRPKVEPSEDVPSVVPAEEQDKAFGEIEGPENVALQALLFQEKFRFVLKPYQFLAVRRLAGFPPLFPLHSGSRVSEPTKAIMSDARFGLSRKENACPTKGILCADEMVGGSENSPLRLMYLLFGSISPVARGIVPISNTI